MHDSVLDGLHQQHYALGELPAAEHDQGQRPPGGERSERQGGVLPRCERLCETSQLLSCPRELGIHALSSIETASLVQQARIAEKGDCCWAQCPVSVTISQLVQGIVLHSARSETMHKSARLERSQARKAYRSQDIEHPLSDRLLAPLVSQQQKHRAAGLQTGKVTLNACGDPPQITFTGLCEVGSQSRVCSRSTGCDTGVGSTCTAACARPRRSGSVRGIGSWLPVHVGDREALRFAASMISCQTSARGWSVLWCRFRIPRYVYERCTECRAMPQR